MFLVQPPRRLPLLLLSAFVVVVILNEVKDPCISLLPLLFMWWERRASALRKSLPNTTGFKFAEKPRLAKGTASAVP